MNLRFGLDLVSVASVVDSIGDAGSRYVERTYTEREIAGCRGSDGIDARRLAERLAVKAATLKVLPVADDALDFRTIEVICDEVGRLGVVLHGRAAEIATADGIGRLAVSVSRDDRLAAAVVAAEMAGTEPDLEQKATTR